MKKKQFLRKYNFRDSHIYSYKRRFPHYVINGQLDYSLMDIELQSRLDIKLEAQSIMADRPIKDLEFLFKGKNKDSLAHQFSRDSLYNIPIYTLIRDSTLKKYIAIIEKYKNK